MEEDYSATNKAADLNLLVKGFKWVIVFSILLVLLYLSYALILGLQFSANYSKWLSHNPTNYSVIVKYTRPGGYDAAGGLEVVRSGQVIQGRHEFDQPIIEWAFNHAQSCVSLWLMCKLFSWSFDYDPVYGYPTYIEYLDHDGLYTIQISDFTQ